MGESTSLAQYTITPVEAALDWLTVTAQEWESVMRLRMLADECVADEVSEGENLHPFFYRGYKGEHVGQVTWGVNQVGNILLQLSGGLADERFERAYDLAEAVTRLDVQVTARIEPYNADLAQCIYNQFKTWQPGFGVKASSRFLCGSDGGSTVYIGSGRSDTLARVYNKDRESKDAGYRGCWRWELEHKHTMAAGMALACRGAPQRDAFCLGVVRQWFDDRGLPPP